MLSTRLAAAALFTAAVCVAESPVAGKWSCTNEPTTGSTGKWTLTIRDDGSKLTGTLTDGEAEIALSEIRFDAGALTFRFYVNAKPYTFDGKASAQNLDGHYSGEEASGALRCERANPQ